MIDVDRIRKQTLRCQASLSTLAFLALVSHAVPLAAQEAAAPASMLSTQQCADQWLEANQLELGANLRPDGSFTFISSAEELVQAPMSNPNWVLARQDAFEKARLNAMREMVAYFKEGVRSDNTVTTMMEGDAQMQTPAVNPPAGSPAVNAPGTSTDVKPETAMAEPGTADPQPTPAKPPSAEPTLSSALRQQINAASEDALVGVVVAKQCEGLPEADGTVASGKYSVSLTLLWSTKLQKLAQSMLNASDSPPADSPPETPAANQPTLKERFAAAAKTRPGWMAYELGVRVYTDADGENVIIGFGAVPATSLRSADVSQADLMARNYIAEFQRTQVRGERNTDLKTSYEEGGAAGNGQFSNGTRFDDKIEVKTQKKQLTGIYPLATWRGRHPESDREMVVVARAWKRSAQAQAQKISPTQGMGAGGLANTAPAGKPPAPLDGIGMSKGDF